MREERWTDIGNDGNIYLVFQESHDAWDYAYEHYPDMSQRPVGSISCFGQYENAVCIQVGIGM